MILKHAQHAEKVPKRASYHARCCSFLVGVFIFILNTRDKKKQRYYLCIFLFCQLRHHKLQLLSAVFIISGFCLVHTKSIFTHASIGSPEHTHSHTLSHTQREDWGTSVIRNMEWVRFLPPDVNWSDSSWCLSERRRSEPITRTTGGLVTAAVTDDSTSCDITFRIKWSLVSIQKVGVPPSSISFKMSWNCSLYFYFDNMLCA